MVKDRQGQLGRGLRLLRPLGLLGLLSEKLGGLRGLSPCGKTAGHSGLRGLLGLLLFLVTTTGLAQIKIGGNVYGGGNKGKVGGNTSVTVKAGNIGAAVTDEERPLENPLGRVFGGARMADVGGRSYVNIDGENATDYIVINRVYGGNDIAGHIGTSNELPEELNNVMPEPTAEELTEAGTREQYIKDYKAAHPEKDTVDISWNSFVHISSKAADNKSIFIGQVFAGGNGYFDYEQEEVAGGKVKHTIYNKGDKTAPLATVTTEAGEVGFQKPEIDKAYLDIQGGTIDYAYGGGNNVTVKKSTVIHVAQPSDEVVTHVWVDNKDKEDATVKASAAASNQTEEAYAEANNLNDLLCPERLTEMGINEVFSFISSEDFQIGKLFGGNNLAEMDIMPGWNLQSGRIRNLYSGGNRGAMTSPKGLLLEIDPVKDLAINPKPLIVDNVYGGCRMADVKPTVEGVYTPTTNLPGYSFPNELSARTLVRGGDINNVYGGNDLTGTVYGGNAVGIYTTVRGDVYGGGNGAYPYASAEGMDKDKTYSDFYFSRGDYSKLTEALNAFRPNAEQVSIRLKGTSAENPTIIQGAVYVGGNCATLDTKKTNPLVELKIGSHVIADKVFMGNNGEKMVDPVILRQYADHSYSDIDLTDDDDFAEYMEGVAMDLQPSIVFDNVDNGDPTDYIENTSKIGSLFLGGNVGSMAVPGTNIYNFDNKLIIFDKLVGGCNSADIPEQEGLNAAYNGGVIGKKGERGNSVSQKEYFTDDGTPEGNIKDRLVINFKNLTIQPMRWNDVFTKVEVPGEGDPASPYLTDEGYLIEGEVYYKTDLRESKFIADGTEDPTTETYYKLTTVGTQLEWDTAKWSIAEDGHIKVPSAEAASDDDSRLIGGNIYGGCYTSGHVNGNVVINIEENIIEKGDIFPETEEDADGNIKIKSGVPTKSGVIFENQRDDMMSLAMSVFGAGYGEETEIWGSTTVNLNKGYAFQIYGGGEEGVVGKKTRVIDEDGNETYDYVFEPRYSSTVNLNGANPFYSSEGTDSELAETEYIYGGGNEGDVCGNTLVNLGNGRIYDAFGGASDADILGHAEVYIGRQPNGTGGYKEGFPWIRDIIYGGNDFGGKIWGNFEDDYDFTKRVRNYETYKEMLHGYQEGKVPDVLKGDTYVEYLQGRVDTIFGGSYGCYDYTNTALYGEGCKMPVQNSSYVNIRPNTNTNNAIVGIFGAGTGYTGIREDDKAQNRSYVLIDIPDNIANFKETEIFGSGSYNGLGMNYDYETTTATDVQGNPSFDLDQASAIIDLLHGRIGNAYGGSYNEGITRRTVVNVPEGSTIQADSIFGGAYGTQILPPCDVYQSQVNYKTHDANARVYGAIFGGNNHERRTLYTQVNISAPVWSSDNGYTATVYGAGRGIDTWAEYTEVNLTGDARVYKAFGGGEMGHVLNAESVQRYMQLYNDSPSPQISQDDPKWSNKTRWENEVVGGTLLAAYKDEWKKDWKNAWTIGSYYIPTTADTGDIDGDGNTTELAYTDYTGNEATNFTNVQARAELDDKTAALLHGKKYNTHVIINKGASVDGYAYGGGYGEAAKERSGDVYGTTYIALLGGTVSKDIYAAGQAGGLDNLFGAENFTASANAYIQGGTCRNVYGGGYEGHVGHHEGDISTSYDGDHLAKANLVIGKVGATDFYNGKPAIMRNVYGGGEGGSVFGTSTVTLNNGMIGYRYKDVSTSGTPSYDFVPELDDQGTNDIELAGNIFGGGYVINSYVDIANINLYGGQVRGSVYGGGEVGPIGRGTMKDVSNYTTGLMNGSARIFKAGQTHVNMFNGHVLRNVFGGGRGKDSWGGDGRKFMKADAIAAADWVSKGYVFGQTDVNIYGGEIGTEEGMEQGFGNVFGGGDEGSVYSAYELWSETEQKNKLYIGKKPENSQRYDKGDEGYYYKYNGTSYVNDAGTALGTGAEKHLTEDCHVLVEPWLEVKGTSIKFDGKTYAVGDYIPTAYLNTLGKKDKETGIWAPGWEDLDVGSKVGDEYKERGVIIHNAVFAGGNIALGSEMHANTKTVFGNATATIHDVYNRDLITIGTGHTGGLYGDGNLTFVDGYRELNVTNYGTDYDNIKDQIDYYNYLQLPPRERAYYELKYKCVTTCTDDEHTTYAVGSTIPKDELLMLFAKQPTIVGEDGNTINSTYWVENGVVSRYAGRILNTIQRADFCGVFGSRMVMRGAKDRVPEIADNTNYTINRVREVSLNKKTSVAGDTGEFAEHGNYFGIYNIVNYLGALTSDVDFYSAVRVTDNNDNKYKVATKDGKAYGTATYADWKADMAKDQRRNNGISHNQVALASGVYLELTTEESRGKKLDEKEWGLITGVVELDLINVSKGIGGGFVYAKNIHGVRNTTGKDQTLLTKMNLAGTGNARAVTNKSYKYIETDNTASSTQETWQTSGNFVHNTQRIIDDCYNVSNRYLIGNRVPAHYWYIWGSVYVYDQYITAHTGAPNAYSKTVELPITISAASHNKMKLLDVQPNLYAYYSSYTNDETNTKLGGSNKLVINDVTYNLNDPISYWDWNLLPASEKNLFVDETYVTSDACMIGNEFYPAGKVMLLKDYNASKTAATETIQVNGESVTVTRVKKVMLDEEGNVVTDDQGHAVVMTDSQGNPVYEPFTSVFHSSNNMSHDTGYLLTYKMTNPKKWNTWFTEKTSTDDDNEDGITMSERDKNQTGGANYEDGPTYHLKPEKLGTGQTSMLLGQRGYEQGEIIPEKIYDDFEHHKPATDDQATFVPAYVVTQEYTSDALHLYKGAAVSSEISGYTAPAFVCTSTIQLSETEFIYVNDLMTESEKTTYYNRFKDGNEAAKLIAKDINDLIVPAYYCTKEGLYGGDFYEVGKNYRALEAYSSMTKADRDNFEFNYDALDLLIDPEYSLEWNAEINNWTLKYPEGKKYQYDSAAGTLEGANANAAHYSLSTPVDYTATYDGDSPLDLGTKKITVTRNGTEVEDQSSIQQNDQLDRETFESLINEQYHYAPIDVTDDDKTKYVINTPFYYKEPYTVGQIIEEDDYNALPHSNVVGELNYQQYVDKLTFTEAGTYYYCRDPYTIDATNGKAVKAIMANKGITSAGGSVQIQADAVISNSAEVPIGFVISQDGQGKSDSYKYGYRSLTNQQLNFTIHGVAPMEVSTLFVSRDANFDDLTKEKIITVIYQYDYEESDESGLHITPVSERHVVRIHVQFESGVPDVGDITPPGIVLPGTSITMRVPSVKPGVYEIIGGGWELFETASEAESHTNFKKYVPSSDPLYWYQDGFYLAYYAKTVLGKTYSNAVPVSVANYHDLKEVMDDKSHHMYVDYDRTRLKRDSKIYINNYSGSKDGISLLKDLYDLSVSVFDASAVDANGLIKDGTFKGHKPLNTSTAKGTNIYDRTEEDVKGVKAGKNLEFFLRTDINHTGSWTPIGNDDDSADDDNCFKGNLHGDGHTISGLDHSLFNNLCGNVYNLGVTGTFNTAGVADKGTGYIESAWVKTDATTALSTKPYAVFGSPTDGTGFQVVNSYFYEGNKDLYTVTDGSAAGPITSGGARGVAKAKPAKAFYDGELAYDLNNFYLYKRYNDKMTSSGTEGQTYSYFTIGDDNKLTFTKDHYYASNPSLCSSGTGSEKFAEQYVEDRFADGDFMYAAGTLPASDERYHVETVKENGEDKIVSAGYYPIWPDDYIFFGQKLTFGYAAGHQDVPTAVARDGGRLAQDASANRVYRAPAYYKSKDMSVVHFNPNVYLAQKENPETVAAGKTPREAYPRMTAIDFAGHNGANKENGTYAIGAYTVPSGPAAGTTLFYPPLLDDDGLLTITNCDETRNLLVYAPAASGTSGYVNAKTYGVLKDYFVGTEAVKTEPVYNEYYDNNDGYRLVNEYTSTVNGHLVQSNLTATNDHLLVDKEDFNAPISYQFDGNHLMWYQRKPGDSEFVDRSMGWQGISLPFTAELVTTDQKGEITHFYSGSNDYFKRTKDEEDGTMKEMGVKDGTDTKVGHEYWLRKLNSISETGDVVKANFTYPTTGDESDMMNKDKSSAVTNTFLWDYYYQYASRKDKNADDYQDYYSKKREYANYPLLTAGIPYLLGLPGQTYYEFDLSGKFEAKNTAKTITKLDKQAITFASTKGVTINVSDDEIRDHTVSFTYSNYVFKPSYMNEKLAASTASQSNYKLADNGSQYNKTTEATEVVAFRPYFVMTATTSRPATRSIIFTNDAGEIDIPHDSRDTDRPGMLHVSSDKHKILVTSGLNHTAEVRIVTTSGITLSTFNIEPGETIETRVNSSGVYMVQSTDGRFIKKIAVR